MYHIDSEVAFVYHIDSEVAFAYHIDSEVAFLCIILTVRLLFCIILTVRFLSCVILTVRLLYNAYIFFKYNLYILIIGSEYYSTTFTEHYYNWCSRHRLLHRRYVRRPSHVRLLSRFL